MIEVEQPLCRHRRWLSVRVWSGMLDAEQGLGIVGKCGPDWKRQVL